MAGWVQILDANLYNVANGVARLNASAFLAHEQGGLEADVSAYSGLVKITGGVTSAVTDNSTNWNTAYTHSQVTTGNPHSLSPNDLDALTAHWDIGGTYALRSSYTPAGTTDLANKAYVDAVAQGLKVRGSVAVISTSNLTLSGEQTIDGYTTSASRILVAGQSTGAQNGIYVTAAGAWARSTDMATGSAAAGVFTFIERGTVNADSAWVCTNNTGSDVVGTDSLVFTQFSGAGQITAGNGLTKTGNTIDAVGTTNRIDVAADAIDISTSYVGQTSITTLGTVATGTWNATAIGPTKGGTGLTSVTSGHVLYASGANTWAAAAPGATSGVQAYDAELTAIAGLTSAADTLPYFTGSGTAGVTTMTAAGRAILDDADATAQRVTLGLVIGTNVQAYDAGLDDIAALATTDGNIIVGSGSNWVAESGATARTSLGLGTTDSPTFADLTISGDQILTSALKTLATGAITITTSLTVVAAESGVTDDMVTINGGQSGQIAWFRADTGDTITIKNGTGNILTSSGDISMTQNALLPMVYDGTNWHIADTAGTVTAHAIGGASHTADTNANVSSKISDLVGVITGMTMTQTLTNKTLTSPIMGTQVTLDQTTGDYTLTWANPAAGRAISIEDPGGTDIFVWKAATQTLTNKTMTTPILNTPDINAGTVDAITSLTYGAAIDTGATYVQRTRIAPYSGTSFPVTNVTNYEQFYRTDTLGLFHYLP